MLEQIGCCQKCNLYDKPFFDIRGALPDAAKSCQVIWVGLSAKQMNPEEGPLSPLSPNTNSGKLIKRIEDLCEDVTTYKTNLVKCLPLTEQQKMRYPTKSEIDCCFDHLRKEIEILKPRIVFLLGDKVTKAVERHLGIHFEKWNGFEYAYQEYDQVYYVPIHHPSYIWVYKRKQVDEYVQGIVKVMHDLL